MQAIRTHVCTHPRTHTLVSEMSVFRLSAEFRFFFFFFFLGPLLFQKRFSAFYEKLPEKISNNATIGRVGRASVNRHWPLGLLVCASSVSGQNSKARFRSEFESAVSPLSTRNLIPTAMQQVSVRRKIVLWQGFGHTTSGAVTSVAG